MMWKCHAYFPDTQRLWGWGYSGQEIWEYHARWDPSEGNLATEWFRHTRHDLMKAVEIKARESDVMIGDQIEALVPNLIAKLDGSFIFQNVMTRPPIQTV
jgi:hypothetical protein